MTTVEPYNLPPLPDRPALQPLDKGATTADLYGRMRELLIYTESLEFWAAEVKKLVE